ncbi:MAG TPA: long-chain-fatty-acid--CoA ligase [Bacillota bacterium]|nr:long-chain-fatty-acid--CoA ligase [Bacillota bacterium]
MHVPIRIDDVLRRTVRLYPDVTAVVEGDQRWTYSKLQEEIHQLARAMNNLGVTKGTRVAVLSPNTTAMMEIYFACFQLGAVVVPLNTRLLSLDYEYIVNHSGAELFFVDAELVHHIEPVKDQLHSVKNFVLTPAPNFPQQLEGWVSFQSFIEAESTTPLITPIEETDYATILYTSGTTGKPKGVIHTHRTLYFNMINTIIHLRAQDHDVLLHTLPIFHVNGWGTPFAFTAVGAKHVMLRKIDPVLIHHLIKTEGVSVACMAPTVLNMLLNEPKFETDKLNQPVRAVLAGSAPPPAFVRKVEQEFGWEFLQVYGMTECAPFITVSPVKNHLKSIEENKKFRLKAKAGIPMLNVELRVVDVDGEDVPADGISVGEIVARGNMVMEGYWLQPEETARSIVNGWYYTGDMGTIDEEGYIDIVDRKKDIIISGGENISSIEIEAALYEHPAILETAVIAVPHEKWGEVPHAFVVVRSGQQLTEEALVEFCRGHLPHFKCPKGISFVSELPKTGSGKIQKIHLRKDFWEGKERLVN